MSLAPINSHTAVFIAIENSIQQINYFMANRIQIVCLIFFLSMAHSWTVPSLSDEYTPSDHYHGSINRNSTFLSIFDDMNKMMAMMHQRFQNLFGSSSISTNDTHDWMDDKNQLDAVEPICTTTTDSPPISSMLNNRRKKLRNTQTTTCIKELIVDGKKHLYKEENETDDQGFLISQSKVYHTISIDTTNSTIPMNTNEEDGIISY